MTVHSLLRSPAVAAGLEVLNRAPRPGHSVVLQGRANSLTTRGALLRGCRVQVRGSRNRLVVHPRARLRGATIVVRGDGNHLEIGPSVRIAPGSVLWVDGGGTLSIGAHGMIEGASLAVTEGTRLTVGQDCLLAPGVDVRTGDSHAVIDLDSGLRINDAADVSIGDHVWIGHGVHVLKGADVAAGCVVGAGSLLTKPFTEPNTVIAGSPARVVRRGTVWTRERNPGPEALAHLLPSAPVKEFSR